jgi:prepilin-type processing-associated H-X9-DG protein
MPAKIANDLGTTADPWTDRYGGGWADATSGQATLKGSASDGSYSSTGGPCAINCNNDLGFYGFHAGGANFLFGDGSVRLLAQSISPRAIVSYISRAAGDIDPGN